MSSSTEAPNMNETQAAKEAASEGLPAASAPSAPRTDATTTTTMTPTTTTPPSLEPTEDGSDQDDAIDAEEEALFRDLEQEQAEQEKQEALHPHAPPTELTEAPLLLKKAFESGEAPLPDSDDEQEGNEASGTTGDQAGGANQATAAGAAAVPAKRAFPSRVSISVRARNRQNVRLCSTQTIVLKCFGTCMPEEGIPMVDNDAWG